MDYARALRSSTERIVGSGYEIDPFIVQEVFEVVVFTDFKSNRQFQLAIIW